MVSLPNSKRLAASLAFVVTELTVLQPAAVLLPGSIWRNPILRAAMQGASPWTRFVPAYQFHGQVIHGRALAKYERPARRLERQHAGTPLAVWMDHLRAVNRQHAWRYLAMLAHVADEG